MRRFLLATLVAFFVFGSPAYADRIVVYPGQNPSSTQTNQQVRFQRLRFGAWLFNALNLTPPSGGVFSNLTVVPNGGMYLAVQPTQTSTLGALYQVAQDDTAPVPTGGFAPSIAADATQIVIEGTQAGPSGSIGPLTAPSSGLQQYYLVEAQLQTVDTTPVSVMFVNSNGTSAYQTVNTVRQDQIVYQVKPGAASSTPAIPAVDTGWIAIATALVPSGTASITSGMIAAQPSFTGFVENGTNVTVNSLTISSLTTAGCLQVNSSGVVGSFACTSGLGSVVGSSPIVASTTGGTATISCPICVTSVVAGANITSSGGVNPTIALVAAPSISGANISAATVPNASLVTAAVTSVTASGNLASSGGTTPAISMATTPTFASVSIGSNGLSVNGSVALSGVYNLNLFSIASGYAIYMNSFASVSNAHFPDAGGLILDRGSLTAGASSFGPTNASVNGPITATTSGTSTLGNVGPCYTAAGAACGGTYHVVYASCSTPSGNTTCTVTLLGAASFASISSYACAGSANSGNNLSAVTNAVSVIQYSGTSFSLSQTNTAGVSTFYATCQGT